MKNPRKKSKSIKKHLFYIFFIALLFILQTIPGLFAIKSVKPFLIIPAVMVIPLVEDVLTAGIYGIVAGILCDTSAFLVSGSNSAFLLVFCTVFALFIKIYLQPSFFTHLLFTAASVFLLLNIHFLFSYGIWRLDIPETLYYNKVIGVSLYTTVTAPVIYFIFTKLYSKLRLSSDES